MLNLNAEKMLNAAVSHSGLGQFLDEGMRKRFYTLVERFNEFGSIEQHAFPAACGEFQRLIVNRLKLARDWHEHPEILEQEITQPFFVVGNARAGTTFAQSILCLDEGHRTPCYWDTRNPSPPPGLNPSADAQAHKEAEAFVAYILEQSPGLLQGHPYFDQKSHTESEDEFLYSTDFSIAYPLHFLKVPSLPQCLAPADPVAALQFHKKMLQQLQWKMPVKRWVGKGIIHQHIMPELLDVFPDAICFWMHRPPEQYIASLLELLEHQYKPFNGELYAVDPQNMVEQIHAGMMHFMSQDIINHPQVHHIRFADFVENPASVLAPIYQQHGIVFSAELEAKIRSRLSDPAYRANRYGKFEYSLDKFGLDKNTLRTMFSDYCERFEL
jgi:hypothetical protein